MFIRIIVNHRGCWSQLLSSYRNISAELLSQKVEGNGVIEGFVVFYYGGHIVPNTIWNDFFSDLKKQTTIVSVERIESNGKGRSYITEISAQQDDSMSDIIHKYDCPYYKEIFYRGYEIWYVYIWYDMQDIFINEIRKIAEILDFKKFDDLYFIDNILPFDDEEANYNVLKYAYNSGYYSAKKQIQLKDIAKTFNTNKSNISRKLKKLENRAVAYYIESRIDSNVLDPMKKVF